MSDKSLLFGSLTRSNALRRARIHPYNLPMNAGRRQVSAAATTASPHSQPIGAAGWRIVLLASLGGSLEFYDFVIFGIFAKDIADAIFPNPTPLISLMVSFAAFAAGYLARPTAASCALEGRRFSSSMVKVRGRSTMPCISRRCC